MLRSVIGAIVSALKSLGRLAGHVATAPFRAVARVIGGGGGDMPATAEAAPYEGDEDQPRRGPDIDAVYRELALAVRTWCADSIIDGQPGPLPPKFPRALEAWLPGITFDEARDILDASERAISEHLRSRELIPGVRSVRPLQAAVWPDDSPPAPNQGSHSFVTVAAGYAPY